MRVLLVSLLAAVAAFGQYTAKFPGATATWQDLLFAKGPARATLSDAVAADATAIPVSDGTQYAGFSAVQIQEEVILICSVAGNTLNVCPGGRGFSGTAAAPHGIGMAVRNTITTHHHNQVAAEVKAIQEALGPNLSNVASSWDNISGKPTTFLFSDQSYTDPAWLTLTKGKVGLGSVENTALSTWAGSTSITTLGTISAGTVPWARLTGQPATWAPSAHTHPVGELSTVGDYSSKITSGTYSINVTGSAGTAGSVTNGVVTTGSYTDPAWLTLTKGKVGLGSVENTALSTWAGTGNITTVGTLSAGTVPWARLTGQPGTWAPSAHSHAIGDLSTVGDYSSKITSGTYSINVTGSAGSAGSVAWGNVGSKPTWATQSATYVRLVDVGCGGSWLSVPCDNNGSGTIDYAESSSYATSAGSAPANGGNADTVDGLHASASPSASTVVARDGNGYLNTGYINSNIGVDGGAPTRFIYDNGDNYFRKTSTATAANAVMNAVAHNGSFAWVDPYIALPTGLVMYGAFTPRANQATITEVWCWSDDPAAVVQLWRSDGGGMLSGNMSCSNAGVSRTDFTGYQVIPVNYSVGISVVSGAPKQVRVGFKYTTAY